MAVSAAVGDGGGRAAAFFDLDRTLMAGSSGLPYARAARRAGWLSRRQMARWGLDHLRFRLRGANEEATAQVLTEVKEVLTGISLTEVERMTPDVLAARRREHPDAEFLVHPECGCVTSAMYYAEADGDVAVGHTAIVSTEQMMRRARASSARKFVIATETGVLHRLRRENPGKEFHAVAEQAECRYMKMITLEKLRDSLRDLKYEITVPTDVARRARRAIDRMLAIG